MKYSIFFALFLISCSFESVSPIQHTEIMSDFYIFEAKNGFEVFYDSGTTKSIQEYYITGSIVFNGSYFG